MQRTGYPHGWTGTPATYDAQVLLLPFVLGVTVLVAYALGGSIRNLANMPGIPYREGGVWVLSGWRDPRLKLWPVAVIALVLQAIPVPAVGGSRILPVAVLLLSYALLIWLGVANVKMPGFALILIGVALNFVVIAANQGMPVSADALRRTGQAEAIQELGKQEDAKHHIATDQDVLRPLGDVIGSGRPFNVVISVGDIVAYAGAAIFLVEAMLGFPASPVRSPGRHRRRTARRLGTQP
jgi:Family of unknown function (DUF5317)